MIELTDLERHDVHTYLDDMRQFYALGDVRHGNHVKKELEDFLGPRGYIMVPDPKYYFIVKRKVS